MRRPSIRKRKDDEIEILRKSALEGSRTAIRESIALGLTIKLISGNKLIEKTPDGKKRVLRKLEREPGTDIELKKGMVLRRK
ncbi:hypothetical protein [Emticicia agri]|uniref:Uncharacterized protein n=1 Tax=Emticicia agri TaxID=2492393 RepID=A0A4Q5M5Z6_9BACT|nr:hypothetical protein [Emticicia agri]RYU97735.1 hypothetical protein EWM59_01020 [Emticicia agri]